MANTSSAVKTPPYFNGQPNYPGFSKEPHQLEMPFGVFITMSFLEVLPMEGNSQGVPQTCRGTQPIVSETPCR